MLVKLTCPGCGRNIEVSGDPGASVRTFPCPACSELVQMPANLLDVGMVIGGFRIIRHLGCGSMGSIYLAEQLSVGRKVAVKVLAEDHQLSDRASEDFIKETRLLAQLDHPNVVGAIDAGVDQGYHYVAMRYLEGENLEQRVVRHGPLPEKKALKIFLLLAKALERVWGRHGILHRDLKPANVMLIEDDEPVLLDLGLSKVYGTQSQYSMRGQLIGTPYYMSPEQAAAKEDVDFRADIYSLGCSLFFTLTGHVPYDAPDIVSVLLKHATESIPSPADHGVQVSAGCEKLLQKMMAKEPEGRHQSWAELIGDIKQLLRPRGRKTTVPRPSRSIATTVEPVPEAQRNGVILAIAIGLGLFLLVAGMLSMPFLLGKNHSEPVVPPPLAQDSTPVVSPPPAQAVKTKPTGQAVPKALSIPHDPEPPVTGPDVPVPSVNPAETPALTLALIGDEQGEMKVEGEVTTLSSTKGDVWTKKDGLPFAYREIEGDCEIVAEVCSITGGHKYWAKAGISIRCGLSADAANASLLISPLTGPGLQVRSSAGGMTNRYAWYPGGRAAWKSGTAVDFPMPMTLRLVREGNQISAAYNTRGVGWVEFGKAELPLDVKAYVGICATGRDKPMTAQFRDVEIRSRAEPATTGWMVKKIGDIEASVVQEGKTLEVTANGGDYWFTHDTLPFVCQHWSGDLVLRARIDSISEDAASWAKVGLMIREDLSRESRCVAVAVSPIIGCVAQKRPQEGRHTYRAFGGDPKPGESPSFGDFHRTDNALCQEHLAKTHPRWLKVMLFRSFARMFTGDDGKAWYFMGGMPIPYDSGFAGVAVSGCEGPIKAKLSNIDITDGKEFFGMMRASLFNAESGKEIRKLSACAIISRSIDGKALSLRFKHLGPKADNFIVKLDGEEKVVKTSKLELVGAAARLDEPGEHHIVVFPVKKRRTGEGLILRYKVVE